MDTARFQQEYRKLNENQRKAVDTIEGPVMVIAGPGTGKTQTLTLRIANILLKTDTAPENILALTFTESGAYSMRKRLVEIVGSPAYRVNIETFHAFCQDLIVTYPDEFPRIIGGTSATDVDRIEILENVIRSGDLKLLRPYGDELYYVRPILQGIQHLKREAISPQVFSEVVTREQKAFEGVPDLYHERGAHKGKMKGEYQREEKNIAKTKELARAYALYEQALKDAKKYDYEDMIAEALGAMERNTNFLLGLQEEFQYILADEHQDTNTAQNRILELLAGFHENPNLFVVGDEKQAIFRFQGASLANFLYFKNRFPSADVITLEENYRSRQDILDAAQSVISHNTTSDVALHAPLRAAKEKGAAPILLYAFSSSGYEHIFVVSDIQEKLKNGVPPEEIAVFYRDNNDVHALLSYLEKTDIPFTVESDRDLLVDHDVRKLVTLFRTAHAIGDDVALAEALYIDFLNIPHLDVHRVIAHAGKQRIPLYNVIKSKKHLAAAGVEGSDTLLDFSKKLSGWSTLARNHGLLETIETIVRESGVLHYIMAEAGGIKRMEALEGILGEAERAATAHRDSTLADFLEYLDVLKRHKVLVKMPHREYIKGVRLMTAHKAKGLEFDYVYVIGAYDKHWGGRASRSAFGLNRGEIKLSFEGSIEDERRLFYVVLTRARKEAVISYAKESIDGRHQLPTQFIGEIRKELIVEKATTGLEVEFSKKKLMFLSARANLGPEASDKEYVRELFLKQGLSVTAVNNYLRCPWEYFFMNLIRLPRTYSKFEIYGTAVHRVLKEYFDLLRTGEDRGVEFMIERLTHLLNREPIPVIEYKELCEKGERALRGYHEAYHAAWMPPLATELRIAGPFLSVQDVSGEDVVLTLTGQIDKVEALDGGVNVVDYKTGKPKSRNELEGKTKGSTGEYKRQLVFYKYLLDRFENKKFDMQSGEIDFVEPDVRGKYKKELFRITDADIAELEHTMKAMAEEILTFSFWNKGCKKKDCRFCILRATMK